MNFVEPIRDKQVIKEIIDYFGERNERNQLMFLCGIYTGLRISDILKLKKKMVKGSHIVIKEQKTKKAKRIYINSVLRKALDKYIVNLQDNDYLFASRQGRNRPITRVRAYEILREAADEFGLKNIGTHTLRKTFGYHLYQDEKDVAMLQDIFNHSDQYITLKYIGVNQDAIDNAMKKLRF